jgi:hypothetical protein
MTPKTAKSEFERHLHQSHTRITDLTPTEGVRLMLEFYRNVRADGCELGQDGDMLLFQWGTHKFSGERSFQINLTRQFIMAGLEDEDVPMVQLSLTFHFAPSAELEALKSGNQWCGMPDTLRDFEAYVTSTAAYQAVAVLRSIKATLECSGI